MSLDSCCRVDCDPTIDELTSISDLCDNGLEFASFYINAYKTVPRTVNGILTKMIL